jgi:hypothetical protein
VRDDFRGGGMEDAERDLEEAEEGGEESEEAE